MPNLSFLKRLIKEDFAKKDQDLIGKIAFVFNPALQQIVNILNRTIKLSDLNAQVKDLEITVDASGNPVSSISFQSTLKGKCTQLVVGRAQCTDNANTFATGGHSINFSDNEGQIVVNNITGLPANTKFLIRVTAYA